METTPKDDDDSVYDGLTPRSMQPTKKDLTRLLELIICLSHSSGNTWQFAIFCLSSLDERYSLDKRNSGITVCARLDHLISTIPAVVVTYGRCACIHNSWKNVSPNTSAERQRILRLSCLNVAPDSSIAAPVSTIWSIQNRVCKDCITSLSNVFHIGSLVSLSLLFSSLHHLPRPVCRWLFPDPT